VSRWRLWSTGDSGLDPQRGFQQHGSIPLAAQGARDPLGEISPGGRKSEKITTSMDLNPRSPENEKPLIWREIKGSQTL
jgi:hypothetical protein